MVATTLVIGAGCSPWACRPIGFRAYSLYLWIWPMTILFGSVGQSPR